MVSGECLCGAVTFVGEGDAHLHVCHCADCRRWTGGPMMAVAFDRGIDIQTGDAVNWYASSEWAERGSCRVCGTALFYRLVHTPHIVATVGSLRPPLPTLEIREHIFADAKPDYYEFSGDAPRLTGAEVFARHRSG